MKKLVLAFFALSFSFTILAQDEQPKHLISIGTTGLGWSGLATKFKWDEGKSGIKDQDSSRSDLKLNYAYTFPNRISVGVALDIANSESQIVTSTDKIKEDRTTTALDLGIGYNFNEDLYNSWFVLAYLRRGSIETETEDSRESPAKTKSDISLSEFGIGFGKRFSLKSWGLSRFSYSPSIIWASASFGDDADDAGLESATAVTLEILRFDFLF